jgi:hypothetical protein
MSEKRQFQDEKNKKTGDKRSADLQRHESADEKRRESTRRGGEDTIGEIENFITDDRGDS